MPLSGNDGPAPVNDQPCRLAAGLAWRGARAFLAGVALLLAGGWFVGLARERSLARELRLGLLSQATALAQSIDPDVVKHFRFDAQDADSPAFQELRGQLRAYGQMVGLSRVRGEAVRDGQIVLGPESGAAGGQSASPPGTVVLNPSPENLSLFRTGQAFTQGTTGLEKSYGLSAFAPVLDPRSGEVLMAVRVDLDANQCDRCLIQHRLNPVWAAACLAALLSLGSVLRWWQSPGRRLPQHRWGFGEAGVVVLAGVVVSVAGAWLAHEREARLRKEVFVQLAESQVALLRAAEREIRDSLRVGLAKLIEEDSHLTKEEFRRYAETLIPNPSVQAFTWVRRVPAAERLRFEAETRESAGSQFTVFERTPTGEAIPASGRDVFYPLLYSQPLPPRGQVVGFDVGSEPVRRAALQRAERTGLASATAPVALLHETTEQKGFLALRPVYQSGTEEQGPDRLPRGFCGAVISFDVLLERALQTATSSDRLVAVDWFDVSLGEQPVWLASCPKRTVVPVRFPPEPSHDPHAQALIVRQPLFAFGKAFVLSVTPGPSFQDSHPPVDGPVTATAGLLLTALTAGLVGAMRGRHGRLEAIVRERTTALRESEQFTRQIIANAGQGIVVYDQELNYRCWNTVMETMTGLPASEVLGKNSDAIADRLEPVGARALLSQALAGGTIYSPDLPFTNVATGQSGWMSAVYGPNLGANGQNIGVIGIIRDISQRKQTELALEKSEAWHRVLFESSTDASVVLDGKTGRCTRANPAAVKMFGVGAESDLIGLKPIDVSPETQSDGALSSVTGREAVEIALDKGSHFFEWTHCRISGEEFSATVLLTKMDLAGEVFLQATVRDVTQERLSAALLAQRSALLSGLLDSIPDLVFFKSRAGVYLGCNPEFSRFAGRRQEEIVGLTDGDLFSVELADAFAAEESIMLAEERPRQTEEWLTYPDGRRILVETLRAPFRSDGDEVIGIIGVSRNITDRKRTEEALQARQEKLDGIFRAAPVAIGVAVKRVLTEVNETFCQITGYTADELIGQSMQRLYSSQAEYDRVAEQGYAALSQRGTFTLECQWQCKDGRLIDVLVRASSVAPGNPGRGVALVGLEITERKTAEQALRQSEERFRRMAETIQCVFWMSSAELDRLLYVSPAYERVWGRPVAGLYEDPLTYFEATHPEDRQRVREHLELSRAAGGDRFDHEYRIVRPDGDVRWIRNRGFPVRTEAGALSYLVGIAEDVTERKLGEALLQSTVERLRMLWQAVEQSLTSVVITDTAGTIEYVNLKFSEVTGYTAEEALGENPRLLKSGQMPVEFYQDLWSTITRGRNWHGEFWNRKKNGELFWESAVISPVKDESGAITHFLGIKQDITERKRWETELQETNRQLLEATARANAMAAKAEAASGAKSQFLANVSHEIRTPLNGVIGTTGLLLETPLTPDQRRCAEIARSSGETLLALMNDILDLSKIDAHKLELETIDFDLREVLTDTTGYLGFKAHEKGLELICEVDPDVPVQLRGDPGRFRQVIANLGANAVKFTPKGKVHIHVRRQDEQDRCLTLLVEVTDTGIGIPREKLSILFAPFTQVDGSITRQFGGTGLGLSISKQLVELMGGRIGVESDLGEGAKFWFTAVFQNSLSRLGGNELNGASLVDVKVLLIEENETSRLMITTWLAKWGCRSVAVGVASEGLAVLRLAASHADPFRIALLSLGMPEPVGAALARQIKADPTLDDTRLVWLSASAHPMDSEKMKAAGLAAVLVRPFGAKHLEKCLRDLVGSLPARNRSSPVPLLAEGGRSTQPNSTFRILLAEDHPSNQLVALEILKRLGYQTDAVSNGLAAIHALQKHRYDLVLMDCQMPEMDGFEATRRIRKGEAGPDNARIPVIALTANAMADQRELSLMAGMNEHICKPVKVQALSEVLQRWQAAVTSPGIIPVAALAPVPPAEGVLSTCLDPATGPKVAKAIFNRADFLSRMMNDEDLAMRVALDFVQELPKQIELLKRAIASQQPKEAARIAHRLKGSASGVGAEVVCQLVSEIERAGHREDPAQLGTLAVDLDSSSAAVVAALSEFGASGASDGRCEDEEIPAGE